MLATLKSRNADIVSCGYYLYENEAMQIPCLNLSNADLDRNQAIKAMLTNKLLGMSAWNKMFKKEILPKEGFPEGFRINEDRYFVFCAITQAQNIAIIPDCLYNYRVNHESASHQKFGEKYLDAVILSEKMYDWICVNLPQLKPEAYACVYSSIYGVLYMIHERKASGEFPEIKRAIVKRIATANFSQLKGYISKSRYYQMLCAKHCEPLLHLMNVIKIAIK